MHQFTNKIKKLIAASILTFTIGTFTLFGQLDPGENHIVQSGKVVGEIFVPQRNAGAALYEEHWVLYPDYVYPSAKNRITTEIVPAANQRYQSSEDFFNKVPFGAGYRYIHVASEDTARLPGR